MPTAFLKAGDGVIAGAFVEPQAGRIAVPVAKFLPDFDPAGVQVVSDPLSLILRGGAVPESAHPHPQGVAQRRLHGVYAGQYAERRGTVAQHLGG